MPSPAALPRWLAGIAAVAVLAIGGALAPDLRILHYLCKPLATVLVAAMVLRLGEPGRYRRALLAGLLLSALGDAFLMLPQRAAGPDWFVFGLGSFLCAHVAYLVAFCGHARLFAARWPFVLYAAVAGAVLALLWPSLPSPLRGPVVAYVVVLAAMAAQAAAVWAVRRERPAAAAAWGGAFFVASDATLALDRFVAPWPAAIVLVLATYWTAQVLIGLSSLRAPTLPEAIGAA